MSEKNENPSEDSQAELSVVSQVNIQDLDPTDVESFGEPTFEPSIPWDSAMELVAIIRSGNLRENRVRAIQLACWVLGCTVTAFGGAADDIVVAEAADDSLLRDHILQAQSLSLESLSDRVESLSEPSVASMASAINPELIALILQILRLIGGLKK